MVFLWTKLKSQLVTLLKQYKLSDIINYFSEAFTIWKIKIYKKYLPKNVKSDIVLYQNSKRNNINLHNATFHLDNRSKGYLKQ